MKKVVGGRGRMRKVGERGVGSKRQGSAVMLCYLQRS